MAGEHEGHRKRIIAKLESGTLLDHELLEVLLFALQPRKNTNDLAHRLLAKFGSIPSVFSASIEELMQVKGVGESIAANIRCIGIVYRKHFLEDKNAFEGRFESNKFLAYAKQVYGEFDCEVVDLYMLDKKGYITQKHRFTDENGVYVQLDASVLSQLLVKERPHGIVLAHNHPFGTAEPSKTDDETTQLCHIVCGLHSVVLCDHIIYSPQGGYSYYLSGKLKQVAQSYTIQEIGKGKEIQE